MKLTSVVLVIAVSIFNIALNSSLKETAKNSNSFLLAVSSSGFFFSLVIGVSSVLCLLALYSTGINLSRGILLMGAISILGGAIYGVIFKNETLTYIEWAIFALIGALLIYRSIIKL